MSSVIFLQQVYAVLLPCIIFLTFYTSRRDVYDVHYAIMGNYLNIVLLLYCKFVSMAILTII